MKLKKRKSSPIFHGWWTVWVTGIISGFGHGFYGLGISVFFKDISAELGINRALTSLAAGVGKLEGGVTSPLVGWLSDRFGPKYVIFSGICIAGTGMILMYFVSSLWDYTIVWGLFIGVGLNIGLTIAVDKALNDWFIIKRGLAQGTKFGLIGVGSVIVLPIVTMLVAKVGWRMTCLLWGSIMLICSPVAFMVVKQKRPEYYGLLPDGETARPNGSKAVPSKDAASRSGAEATAPEFYTDDEAEFTFKQAVKTRAYWFIAIAMGIQMFIMGGINIHLVPFLTDIGISRAEAGAMMGFMVFFTIPSRFFGGVLSDRVGKNNQNLLLAGVFLMQAVSILVLLASQSKAAIYIFLGLYGFASGATTPLFILTLGSYFGRKAFGTIFGSSMAIRAPISLVAPIFAGWIFDTTGSYTKAFMAFFSSAVTASLFIWWMKPVDNKADI